VRFGGGILSYLVYFQAFAVFLWTDFELLDGEILIFDTEKVGKMLKSDKTVKFFWKNYRHR